MERVGLFKGVMEGKKNKRYGKEVKKRWTCSRKRGKKRGYGQVGGESNRRHYKGRCCERLVMLGLRMCRN